MSKYVTLEAHLSPDELAYRYRKAVNPVETTSASIPSSVTCNFL